MSEPTSLRGSNILVTGGAGQIGRRLVPVLVREGARVAIFDRVVPRRLTDEGSPSHQVRWFQCGIADVDLVAGIAATRLGDVEHVVHLASRISNDLSTGRHMIRDVQSDLIGTLLLLERLPSLRSLCFTSSIMVYGRSCTPLIREDHATEPENTYGLLKLATEKALRLYHLHTGCPVAVLRLSAVYGLNAAGNRAIPTFVRSVLEDKPPTIKGDGSVRRDYLHIDDAIDAIVSVLKFRADGIFNIGSGVGTSVAELAETVIKAAGKNLAPQYLHATQSLASQASLVLDIRKARTQLGFRSRYSIESGIRKLIAEVAQS